MNLWVNRLGQLSLLTVALFFFACEDETSLNGFKNPNSKFKGKYIEIPLTTSNLLLGDVRTSNYYFSTEYNRFMVGRYVDPELGAVTANAVTQFYTSSTAKLPADYEITGVSIDLAFDLYLHGPRATGDQTISIYEVAEPLDAKEKRTTYYDKEIQLGALVAEKTFSLNPELFQEYIEWKSDGNPETPDTTVVMKVDVLEGSSFYQRLVSAYEAYSFADPPTAADSMFVKFTPFTTAFPGLAFVSSAGTNIMGFSTASLSRVVIHYKKTTPDPDTEHTQSLLFNYSFMYSANQILAERTGDLAGLEKWEEQPTTDGTRYIQSGSGLVTKLNLDNFYAFTAQNSDKNLFFNSAQIVIGDVAFDPVTNEGFEPPRALVLRLLDENNRPREYAAGDEQITELLGLVTPDYETFTGQPRRVLLDNDSTYFAVGDGGSGVALFHNQSKANYSGFLTLLFQRLYALQGSPNRLTSFALYPSDPSTTSVAAKSVNRTVFPSDKVVLRIFYTEPTVNKQD